jgi:hypothetical protein
LIAVVLPFEPFVETTVSWTQTDPEEILIKYYEDWEDSVHHLIKVDKHKHTTHHNASQHNLTLTIGRI